MAAPYVTGTTNTRSQVVINIEKELKELDSVPQSHCIYRVPEILRNGNEEAYTPQVISIGPYHYKKENLYGMRSYKLKYLKSYLERTNKDLDTYFGKVQKLEGKVREYYNDDINLSSDEMVNMILTDGVFVVEFLLRIAEEPYKDDEIFKKRSLKDDIIHDMIMLENQLPLFLLKALYTVHFPSTPSSNSDVDNFWMIRLYIFSTHYFGSGPRIVNTILKNQSQVLLQLKEAVDINKTRHLLDFVYDLCVVTKQRELPMPSSSEPDFELVSFSATELKESMVKLEPAYKRISSHMEFSGIWLTEEGALQIPHLLVNRHTESVFRNVIAYEHCHRKGHVFRSYAIFMDHLIDTPNDVNLLIKKGIIKNSLGDSEQVSTLFNNLYKITMMRGDDFCYTWVCKNLNKYSRDRWQGAWFRFKKKFRGIPWKIISIFGVVSLSLTIIQTACSIKSTRW